MKASTHIVSSLKGDRPMLRKLSLVLVAVVVSLLVVVPAFAQAPNFGAGIWADGQQWGTKGLRDLPPDAPDHAFDKIYIITDGERELQAPVAEASPTNPEYNGGRWAVHVVTVTNADAIDSTLTSEAQVLQEQMNGNLIIGEDVIRYFECPLLPFRE
jgi:hypothetical protein